MIDDPIRVAVREGLQDALADPKTWEAIRGAFAHYARSEAGGFTLGVIGNFAKWVFRFGLVIALVWSMGGLPAVFAFLKGGASH